MSPAKSTVFIYFFSPASKMYPLLHEKTSMLQENTSHWKCSKGYINNINDI